MEEVLENGGLSLTAGVSYCELYLFKLNVLVCCFCFHASFEYLFRQIQYKILCIKEHLTILFDSVINTTSYLHVK